MIPFENLSQVGGSPTDAKSHSVGQAVFCLFWNSTAHCVHSSPQAFSALSHMNPATPSKHFWKMDSISFPNLLLFSQLVSIFSFSVKNFIHISPTLHPPPTFATFIWAMNNLLVACLTTTSVAHTIQRQTTRIMIGRDMEWSGLSLTLGSMPAFVYRELNKIMKDPSRKRQSPGRDFNSGFPEY
jgi:hypothetical protein